MLQFFKAAYFVVTSEWTYGRSLDLNEALALAKARLSDKKMEIVINIFLFDNEATPEIMANILKCYMPTETGTLKQVDILEAADVDQIQRYLKASTYYQKLRKSK